MRPSIFQEIKVFFFRGSILARLVGINLIIFLIVNLVRVFCFLLDIPGCGHGISQWLGISSNVHVILHRPWTAITYMFLHFELFHIFFNMIVLYVGGRLFSDFIGPERLFGTYLLGGLMGALFYVVSFNVFPAFRDMYAYSVAMGASASVLAVFVAIAVTMPNYRLPLILLGQIPLKYIALFFVILDVISIDKGNPGGHLAHLGGACWGFVYATLLKKGKDPALHVGRWADALLALFRRKPVMRVEYHRDRPLTDDEYNRQQAARRSKMDEILDKISHSGYDSLSEEEKEMLFRMKDKP